MKKNSILLSILLALPACELNCYEDDPEMCSAEPCEEGIAGDDGADEIGGGDGAQCSAYVEPLFHSAGYMFCGVGPATDAEHLTHVAASIYKTTDYYPETQSWTGVVLWDDDQYFPESPEDWEGSLYAALPGVVVYGEEGDEQIAYLSRGCCAQSVVEGSLPDGPPHNPACSGGPLINSTPLAYCLDMLDGKGGGACIYPCATNEDCPDDSFEFCDLSHPDPYGAAPGVCRYLSMPEVPTELSDIVGALPGLEGPGLTLDR